jgi:hypothetical protein
MLLEPNGVKAVLLAKWTDPTSFIHRFNVLEVSHRGTSAFVWIRD